MNICIVTRTFPARSETFVLGQAMGLAARGCHVRVLSHGPGGGITREELDVIGANGIERIVVPRIPGSRIKRILFYAKRILANPFRIRFLKPGHPWSRRELFEADRMLRQLKRSPADVTHVQFGINAAALLQVGRIQNLVVTWHGFDVNLVPKTRGVGIYRRLFASNAIHTANSRFLANRLHDLGVPPASLSIVPMGVDTGRFTPPQVPRHRTGTLRILSVGRLVEVKGHAFLIDAVARLLGEGRNLSLRIVGEGQERTALETRIDQLGVRHAVTMLGQAASDTVLREMHEADVFALTGIQTASGQAEAQGVVYAEAQATGLPVIGSNVGGVPESIIDGQTGYLCPPGDTPAIAAAIRRFLDAPETLDTFGAHAREFVVRKFGRDAMIDQFERLYLHQAAPPSWPLRGCP